MQFLRSKNQIGLLKNIFIKQINTHITLFHFCNLELDAVNAYGAVGFSAVMTINASISDGSAVIYDTAITNIGNTYDTTSGTFTAPLEGTYVFHFHALSHADEVSSSSVQHQTEIEHKLNNYYKQALIRYWTRLGVYP